VKYNGSPTSCGTPSIVTVENVSPLTPSVLGNPDPDAPPVIDAETASESVAPVTFVNA